MRLQKDDTPDVAISCVKSSGTMQMGNICHAAAVHFVCNGEQQHNLVGSWYAKRFLLPFNLAIPNSKRSEPFLGQCDNGA